MTDLEAADRIASLEAENARLREQVARDEGDAATMRGFIATHGCTPSMMYSRAVVAERQLAEARRALEPKGLADAYRDGFDAALHTADSFKSVVVWGPSASPTDAYNAGVQHLREVLHKARAALAPAENARLREERDEYERERNQWRADCQQQLIYTTEALQRAETAEAQLAEAREALEPFAKFAAAHDGIDGIKPDLGENYVWLCPSPGYPQITTADFRRARAALAAAEKPGSDGEG